MTSSYVRNCAGIAGASACSSSSCNVAASAKLCITVEVDLPANITQDSRDDWASVLAQNRQGEFKPISTTERG